MRTRGTGRRGSAGRAAKLVRRADGTVAASGKGVRSRSRHLLSGFLECGHCGGGFHSIYRDKYGCGWWQKRGTSVCPTELRIDRTELEGRVLRAVEEQILVPEHGAYAVERAVELVQAEVGAGDGYRERLEAIEAEIERLVELGRGSGTWTGSRSRFASGRWSARRSSHG